MGDDPWNRNEGKFDKPSSSIPTGHFVGTGTRRKFVPSSEALRDFGADRAPGDLGLSGARIGVIIIDDPHAYHGVEPVKRYDDKPGRRIRKDKR